MKWLLLLLLVGGCQRVVEPRPFVVTGKEHHEVGSSVGLTSSCSLGYGATNLTTGGTAIVMGGTRGQRYVLLLGSIPQAVTQEQYERIQVGDTLWVDCWVSHGRVMEMYDVREERWTGN